MCSVLMPKTHQTVTASQASTVQLIIVLSAVLLGCCRKFISVAQLPLLEVDSTQPFLGMSRAASLDLCLSRQ